MRPPSQTRRAVEADLKHFSTALDRAKSNTSRSREKNRENVELLSQLIKNYTNEVTEQAVWEANEQTRPRKEDPKVNGKSKRRETRVE